MSMRVKKIVLLSALILCCGGVSAQEAAQLDLEQCRTLALEHNRKVQMAQLDAVASDYLVKSAKTKYLPRIDFVGGWVNPGDRALQPFAFNFDVPGLLPQGLAMPMDFLSVAPEQIFTGGFVLRQPIFLGTKIVQANKIASSLSNIAHEEVILKQADVIGRVDTAYWRVISVQEKVQLAKAYKALLDRLANDLENIYQEGIITRNELLRVQVKQNEVALSLVKAENGLQLSRMALAQLLGMDEANLVLSSAVISEQELIPRLELLAEQKGDQRVEIAMLNDKLKSTQALKAMVKSQFLPNVFLTAGYVWATPNIYKGSQHNFGGDWAIGIGVRVPLFTWGDRIYQTRMAEQKVQQAKLELAEAQELIALQIKRDQFQYSEALKKIELTKLSVQQAAENLRVVQNTLDEGMKSTKDILEAQAMWERASSDNIDARIEAATALSELEKSTGALYQYIEQHNNSQQKQK
ncbi:TolC family protein [Porphyromonas miyakawae]|uniref:TolC family protein n=2 Tax=Porphyromonas miyakawae TaxID=3137470 RepID=A0ABQ0E3S3_9PORP